MGNKPILKDYKSRIKIFCLNDIDDAEEFSNICEDPACEWVKLSDNWDQAGFYRVVIKVMTEEKLQKEDIVIEEERVD